MTQKTYDVVGIGNAIVDVIARCDDSFLDRLGTFKGTMMLVDEAQAQTLYREMGAATECAGGSVANTMAAMASLGGKCAYIGKVRNDQFGEIFEHDMRSVGVDFTTASAKSGATTGRCMVLVTPDGQRTMHTYLGICSEVTEADIDETIIAASRMLYIEGYLWDLPHAIEAIRKALAIAKQHDVKVAFSLSDLFCVERHRLEFMDLIENHLDIVFANEAELRALCMTSNYEDSVAKIQGKCATACLTRSEKGSLIVTRDNVETIKAVPISQVLDSTGAGDLYAAGFLYGLAQGWTFKASGELASACAAEIIQQMGARCQKPLRHLLAA